MKCKNYRIVNYEESIKLKPYFKESNTYSITTTNKHLKYAFVTIYSVIINTKENVEIIIITDGISAKKLMNFAKKFLNVYFTLVLFNRIDSFENPYWPPIIIKRILLMTSFFSNYKKILSLETDTIVINNIDNLFIEDRQYFVSASKEFSISNEECLNSILPRKYIDNLNKINNKKLLKNNISFKDYVNNYLKIEIDDYRNCGIVLFSFDKFKNQDIEKRILELKKFVFLDQDFINTFFKNEISLLNFEHNYNCYIMNGVEINNIFKNYFKKIESPKIVHFCGASAKPWQSLNTNNFYQIWWKYAKEVNEKYKFYYIFLYIKNILSIKKKLLTIAKFFKIIR